MSTVDPMHYPALMNLYARYCHAVDSSDPVAIQSCFTLDTVLEVFNPGRDGTRLEPTVYRGRNLVLDRMVSVSSSRLGYKHLTTDVMIEAVGDPGESGYRGVANFRVLDDTAQPESMGRYHDEIRRSPDGDWQFAHRTIRYGWQVTW